MTTDVVLLCPRKRDHGHRDRLWSFGRSVWAEMFPDWPIYEGHHEDGPFNRSAAINRAAEAAGDWELAVIIDGDVLPSRDGILEAVAVARTGRPASGFSTRYNLNRVGTERILGGYKGSWRRYIASQWPDCISGACAINRELWDEVGGFDELFVGWGFEDTAFRIACEAIYGERLFEAEPPLWHLWHPVSPEHNKALPEFQSNTARHRAYHAAQFDREAVELLLVEARDARAGRLPVLPPPHGRPTRIPRILHRTVPEQPSEEANRFWMAAGLKLPGWELMDHHDPLDPTEWETGDLWPLCDSGAQKAGLIRLEALHRFGGVYIDSDFELYRSLEPLLCLEGFAGWEDAKVVPDAVLGFRAGHPALAIMLEKARAAILRKEGAWVSGPGVTTSTLPGRDDVTLLPPGSFYPYHYKEKHRRDEDHASAQPWAFGAHHWAHSWAGR